MFGVRELSDGIVVAAASGSQADLNHVLRVMERQINVMIMARLSSNPSQFHAVEEISQTALVGLTTGLCRLETKTVVGLKAFVSGIVARKVADHLRERPGGERGGPPLASLDSTIGDLSHAGPLWQFLSLTGTSPSGVAERAERLRAVMIELGKLKPQYREVITLAFFDQLATAQIAVRMEISRPAASMLLIRAVKALRRNVGGSSLVEGGSADVP